MRTANDGKDEVSDQATEWALIIHDDPAAQCQSSFRDWVGKSPHHYHQYLRAWSALQDFIDVEAVRETLTQAFELGDPQHAKRGQYGLLALKVRRVCRPIAYVTLFGVAVVMAISLFVVFPRLFKYSEHRPVLYSKPGLIDLGNRSAVRLSGDPRAEVRALKGGHGVLVTLFRGTGEFSGVHSEADPLRVFAGHTLIDVFGTDFEVRRTQTGTGVMVKDGRVRLSSDCESTSSAAVNREFTHQGPQYREIVLAGGQSAAIPDSECEVLPSVAGQRDSPARQHGTLAPEWLVFNNTTLGDAIGAFNLWNVEQLVVTDPVFANLRVSGRFRTSDPESFVAVLTERLGARATRTKAEDGSVVVKLFGRGSSK
jgi:ferric-dicitrate binding protein FerR (iron transport regulator)